MPDNSPDIIPATREAQAEYSERDWGSMTVVVDDEDIEALKNGKQFAIFGGEYTTYIIHEDDHDE